MLLAFLLATLDRNACNVSRLSSRLVGVVIFATIFVVPSAFGQTDYSDSWLDDSDPNALYIVGAGVTDNDYSADEIAVETTLTSPNGRTVTGESDDYGSARMEVTLPWDWDDLGDYFVHTTHQPLCWGNWDGSMLYEWRSGGHVIFSWNPDYFRCMASRETTVTSDAGRSVSVYENTFCLENGCVYSIVEDPPCTTSCKWPQITTTGRLCRAYLIRTAPFVQVFGRTLCSSRTARDEESNTKTYCYDGL